jgi:hypothetical protein
LHWYRVPWPAFLALALTLFAAGGVGLAAPKLLKREALRLEEAEAAVPKFEDAVNFRSTKPMQLALPVGMSGTPQADLISLEVRKMRNRMMAAARLPRFPKNRHRLRGRPARIHRPVPHGSKCP